MPEPDVTVAINQLEIPDSFGADDLTAIQQGLNAGGLRAEVSVDPSSAPRDLVVVPALLVIHFLSQHGLDIALSVAESAFWDGIKTAFHRLRPEKQEAAAPTHVKVTYPNGQTIEADVPDTDHLIQVIRELAPAGGAVSAPGSPSAPGGTASAPQAG